MSKPKKAIDKCKSNVFICMMVTIFSFNGASYGVVWLSQYILEAGIGNMHPGVLHLNALCVAAVFLLIYFITLKTKASLIIGSALCLLLATANYYTYSFRGNEVAPSDILAIGTAMSVAGNYTFSVGPNIILPWLVFVDAALLCIFIPEYKWKSIWKPRAGALLVFLLIVAGFLGSIEGHYSISWQNYGSLNNGYIFNFALQMKEMYVEKPEGYSSDEIDSLSEVLADGNLADGNLADGSLADGSLADGSSAQNSLQELLKDTALESGQDASKEQSLTGFGKTRCPDVIVIMDEAYSDLSVLGLEPKTNQPVTPFIDSLSDNTVKGTMAVSVIGGGTSTSEYEALTGNTHLFLENTSSSYQQYVRDGAYSVVSDMKQMGYTCIGMHPYYPSGWNRANAYEYMGFDETYFLEDFPQEDMIRDYVSDQEMFELIIKKYEEKKVWRKEHGIEDLAEKGYEQQDYPLFVFGVTMQNHGGYTYEGDNYEESIVLQGYAQEYKDANQYLSLLHETDKAVEYLINYFVREEREVIVVFFGDHQPSLDEGFMTALSDVDYDTAEERLRRYTVPYFIWANYDIEEKERDMISLNYLMNEVYQTAGMELPPYQRFLSILREQIPYMNRYAYYSKEQNAFVHLNKAQGKEKELLDLYWKVQYNNMFDRKHRNEVLFPLVK